MLRMRFSPLQSYSDIMISIEKVVRRSLLHVFCSLLGVHGLLMVGPTDCKDNQGGEHVLGGQVSAGEFRVNSAWFMDLLHDFLVAGFNYFVRFHAFFGSYILFSYIHRRAMNVLVIRGM